MNLYRRTSLTIVVVLVALLVVPVANAHPAAPILDATWQEGGQSPEDICAAAVADLQEPETRSFDKAGDVLEDGVDYWAILCTERGPIYLDLFENEAPITVNNFVYLAQQGFYNNITFHRVIPGFMLQGGDPTGTGSGGPGYMFEDETGNGLSFDTAGLLAMANSGENTNGSQFFVTYAPTSWLDGAHTIFGSVYQGMANAELITPRDPQQSPGFDGDMLNTVVIIEDAANVVAEADPLPTIDHFQTMLTRSVAGQINEAFVVESEYSHVYDLDAEAESWADNGDDLVNFMRAYLSDSGFVGTAALLMPIGECPATASELPIWLLGFQVSDYSAEENASKVVFDDERSDQLIAAGAYESYTDTADGTGRYYQYPVGEDQFCGPTGIYYRLEIGVGRYVLVTDMVLDSNYINAETDPTPEEYLSYVLQQLLYSSISGVIERGNAG